MLPYTAGMVDTTSTNEWDAPPPGAASPLRAAVITWIIGAGQTFLFGLGTVIYGLMALLPEERLHELVRGQNLPEEQLTLLQPWLMAAFALCCLLLGFIPGVAYVLLGFGIHRGKRLAFESTQMLLLTQAIVLGIFLLLGVSQALAAGSPRHVTLNIVVLGTPLALLITGIRWVAAAKRQLAYQTHAGQEPWDQA